MLEEIQITVNGMNTRLANIENLLRAYLYCSPTPYNSSSLKLSSCSFSSPQTCTVPLETLLTAGGGEVNNSLSMEPVTPEVEDITPNERNQSTPEMQDLMWQNLATTLVRTVYSEKERETSNVNGRRGKKRLDPIRMSIVRQLTYTLKPLKPGESEDDDDWKKSCTKAIDSANRK